MYSLNSFCLSFNHTSYRTDVTLLERIYLLRNFYDLKLGAQLFQLNLDQSRENEQAGMWLHVWQENKRAIDFYLKNGFTILKSPNSR